MDKQRAVVIGSGFGGLSVAIRLQAQGIPTTVLEKRDLPGGRAYVFKQDGFTFDAGPTVVTAPNCLEELFELSGKKMQDYVELLPIAPMYRLHWESGYKFDYSDNVEETIRQIRLKAPEDAKRYPAFLKYTEKVFEEGYTKLAAEPFLNWWSMIRVSPQLMGLSAYRSVYSMVSKYIADPDLAQAFSFHSLLVGGNPFSASAIYTLIHFLEKKWGVFFPRGGTGALVQGLTRLFQDLGGEIHCNCEVDEIQTDNKRVKGVRLKSGELLPADIVVSNADVFHTYHHLLKKESLLDGMRKRVARSRYSMSLFLIYFGTKRRYSELAHHNVIFGKRYRGLLNDIFKTGNLADDFSLYVHKPTVTDPSLAPEGCETFYALSPVPHLGIAKTDWKTEGPKYADRILSYLEDRYLPGLRSEIVSQRIFTPLDFESELNAHLGSAFSLEPVLWQSAYFRTHNRDPKIQGLYFAGAGTHPGAGVPGVVNSAKATSKLILEDLKEMRPVASQVPSPHSEMEEVQAHCRKMITVGSKSFSMASRLFKEAERDGAFFLYGWCRYCDDQIDEIIDTKKQLERLASLRSSTRDAFAQKRGSESVFEALRYIAGKYKIPSQYAEELLNGMEMDIRKDRYPLFDDLVLYCYRVAGTVGLMMSHVMGVSDEKALRHASDMGIAMQLTNIARDVVEDAEMGRMYLPIEWLSEEGLSEKSGKDLLQRDRVQRVVRKLLREADRYYASGNAGLKFLPFRAAFAVAAASRIYSEIGRLVLARGSNAWDTRTVVSTPRKLRAVGEGLWLVLRTVPYRMLKPWKRAQIGMIWNYEWNLQEIS